MLSSPHLKRWRPLWLLIVDLLASLGVHDLLHDVDALLCVKEMDRDILRGKTLDSEIAASPKSVRFEVLLPGIGEVYQVVIVVCVILEGGALLGMEEKRRQLRRHP